MFCSKSNHNTRLATGAGCLDCLAAWTADVLELVFISLGFARLVYLPVRYRSSRAFFMPVVPLVCVLARSQQHSRPRTAGSEASEAARSFLSVR